uniref:Protein sleepless n=1 Tax=Photinus pyralis TaxID=7054 RepID=A0A1Y1LEI0_PHOPY
MKLLLAILISTSFMTVGVSKQCFTCVSNEKNENNCSDPFTGKSLHRHTCDVPSAVCVIEKTAPGEATREHVFRGCVASDYCTVSGKHARFCQTCDVDFCNSSAVLTASLLMLSVLYLMKFVI